MRHTFTIAIDGPAGAGKGTLARRLADHYRLNLLDTGLTYRAVAHALIQYALPLDNVSAAETAARQVDLAKLDRAVLSAHAVGEAASKIGASAVIGAILGAAIGGKKGAAIGGTAGAAGGTAVVASGGTNPATLSPGTAMTVKVTKPFSVRVERNQFPVPGSPF